MGFRCHVHRKGFQGSRTLGTNVARLGYCRKRRCRKGIPQQIIANFKGGEAPEDHGKFFLRAKYFLRQIQSKHSVGVLKALILATLYLFAEENYDLLWQYKTLAVGSAYKLGLHRCQKKMKLGPLTTEMRKRVFWSLYVVDSFSSAIVGLPQLLDDRQINTEFPADLYYPS